MDLLCHYVIGDSKNVWPENLQTFIIYFCRAGIQKQLSGVLWLRVSPEVAGKLRQGLWSHLKAPLGEDQLPCLLAQLLAGLSSSWAAGPRVTATPRKSHLPQPASSCMSDRRVGKTVRTQDSNHSLLRRESQSCPRSRGGDYSRM